MKNTTYIDLLTKAAKGESIQSEICPLPTTRMELIETMERVHKILNAIKSNKGALGDDRNGLAFHYESMMRSANTVFFSFLSNESTFKHYFYQIYNELCVVIMPLEAMLGTANDTETSTDKSIIKEITGIDYSDADLIKLTTGNLKHD